MSADDGEDNLLDVVAAAGADGEEADDDEGQAAASSSSADAAEGSDVPAITEEGRNATELDPENKFRHVSL